MWCPEGRVVVIGSRGSVEIDPRDAMRWDAGILGAFLFAASEIEQAAFILLFMPAWKLAGYAPRHWRQDTPG